MKPPFKLEFTRLFAGGQATGVPGFRIFNAEGVLVCEMQAGPNEAASPLAFGYQILACLNACGGLPQEALEAGVIGKMLEVTNRVPELASWNSGARISFADGKGTLSGVSLGPEDTHTLLDAAKLINPSNVPVGPPAK